MWGDSESAWKNTSIHTFEYWFRLNLKIRNSRHHSHHFWHISGVNKDHLGGQDKVFEIRDRNHRIRRQILRQNVGLIIVLVKVENFHLRALEAI